MFHDFYGNDLSFGARRLAGPFLLSVALLDFFAKRVHVFYVEFSFLARGDDYAR
jgi:hypothetical protein